MAWMTRQKALWSENQRAWRKLFKRTVFLRKEVEHWVRAQGGSHARVRFEPVSAGGAEGALHALEVRVTSSLPHSRPCAGEGG